DHDPRAHETHKRQQIEHVHEDGGRRGERNRAGNGVKAVGADHHHADEKASAEDYQREPAKQDRSGGKNPVPVRSDRGGVGEFDGVGSWPVRDEGLHLQTFYRKREAPLPARLLSARTRFASSISTTPDNAGDTAHG